MYMTTRTTRMPGVGDIWLVDYPYKTPGNMSKPRPGIIVDFDDDNVIVQKLTIIPGLGLDMFPGVL